MPINFEVTDIMRPVPMSAPAYELPSVHDWETLLGNFHFDVSNKFSTVIEFDIYDGDL